MPEPFPMEAQAWIPDLRFAASGMTRALGR
ncbi:hypothetical protein BMIN10S_01643 [Bosea minatitlanensis]